MFFQPLESPSVTRRGATCHGALRTPREPPSLALTSLAALLSLISLSLLSLSLFPPRHSLFSPPYRSHLFLSSLTLSPSYSSTLIHLTFLPSLSLISLSFICLPLLSLPHISYQSLSSSIICLPSRLSLGISHSSSLSPLSLSLVSHSLSLISLSLSPPLSNHWVTSSVPPLPSPLSFSHSHITLSVLMLLKDY